MQSSERHAKRRQVKAVRPTCAADVSLHSTLGSNQAACTGCAQQRLLKQPLKSWLTCAALNSFLAVRAASCSAWCSEEIDDAPGQTGWGPEQHEVWAGQRIADMVARSRLWPVAAHGARGQGCVARIAAAPFCSCHLQKLSPPAKGRTRTTALLLWLPACLRGGASGHSKHACSCTTHPPVSAAGPRGAGGKAAHHLLC